MSRRPARLRVAAPLAVLLALGSTAAARKPPAPAPAPAPRCERIEVRGELAFAALGASLVVLDVARPDRPRDVASLPTSHAILDFALGERIAALATGRGGVWLVGLDDPLAPQVVGRFATVGSARRVVLVGDRAFVADSAQGLIVLDLSNPRRPIQRARIPTRAELNALVLSGSRLATAEGTVGVRLFDVSNPDAPREIAALREAASARDVAWMGDLLLVAAGRRGLLTFRAAPGTRPVPLSELATPEPARHVAPRGTDALVSCGGAGVRVVDLADPVRPRERTAVGLGRGVPPGRITVAGDHAWLAAGAAGIGLLRLQEEGAPQVVLPRRRGLKISFPPATTTGDDDE